MQCMGFRRRRLNQRGRVEDLSPDYFASPKQPETTGTQTLVTPVVSLALVLALIGGTVFWVMHKSFGN